MQRHQLHYPLRTYIRPYRLIRHFPIASFDPRECERDLCEMKEKIPHENPIADKFQLCAISYLNVRHFD